MSTEVGNYCRPREGRDLVKSLTAHPVRPSPGSKISGLLHWLPTIVAQRIRAAVGFLIREPNVMAEIRLAGSDKPYTFGDPEKNCFIDTGSGVPL